jgi:4-hydroxy-tetrahydrodipicolinate synthase
MSDYSRIFTGVHTALVTPLREGRVAWEDLESLVEQQIQAGVDGIVAVGTTGESPTLSHAEHIEVIQRVSATAAGRVPVIAGTGSNSTHEAVELSVEAEGAGADGLLQVTPYYNKPNQEGLFRHFGAVAEKCGLPILLYSIPGRCVISIDIETMARLHEAYPHITAVKEAGGSTDRVGQIVRTLGRGFPVLSGDDSMTLPFTVVGGSGVVSVASNLFVEPLRRMLAEAAGGDLVRARELHQRLSPLFSALFVEPNPVPVKVALAQLGRISSEEVRLPLAPATDGTRDLLRRVLAPLADLA